MLWHVMNVLDCGKCEKVLFTTRGKWNVENRDELFVDLRRRRPFGLLETREAMLNCEEDGLLGCLNQWERALRGLFPGRRTVDSELVRTRGIRLFN